MAADCYRKQLAADRYQYFVVFLLRTGNLLYSTTVLLFVSLSYLYNSARIKRCAYASKSEQMQDYIIYFIFAFSTSNVIHLLSDHFVFNRCPSTNNGKRSVCNDLIFTLYDGKCDSLQKCDIDFQARCEFNIEYFCRKQNNISTRKFC